MASLQHVYARSLVKDQFVLILADTFPSKSLLFGSNTRKFSELIYEPKATKTGGGFGRVVVDEFGVPSIVGATGEYTFSWYVLDKVDAAKYGPFTCVMTTTAFPDTTAPTVTITTTGGQTDLRPALVGTINDATARVVVTINNKDYVAVNDGVGGWSIPINTIDAITIDTTAVTVRAIDGFDNVGSASTTISYSGSAYAFVSDFDVSVQAAANGWTNGQDVSTLSSSVGSSVLAGTTATTKPAYDSSDNSLVFTQSPADRLYSTTVDAYREIFVVLTDQGAANFLTVFQARSASGTENSFNTGDGATKWRFNTTNILGRLANQKQIVHLRYTSGSAIVSTNGGTEYTVAASVSDIDLSKIYVHDSNLNGTPLKLHEIVTTGKLNSAQRSAVINDLKTKWGIA
jgi:hypothetical protein